MLRNLMSAGAAMVASGAVAAGGVHWSVDAPTASGTGFVVYGVLFVGNGLNGAPPNAANTDFRDFFLAPFDTGSDVVDFGMSIDLAAADAGPSSITSGTMTQVVTVDGDGTPSVEVVCVSEGSTSHTGASSFGSSSDPNDRAVVSLDFLDTDSRLPVRVMIEWTSDMTVTTAAGVARNGQLGHQLGIRRGTVGSFLTIVHESKDVDLLPRSTSGSHLVVIAPGDDRSVDFSARTFGVVEFTGAEGLGVHGEAGAFESVFGATIVLRQFCPGDTDGDDAVDFADLNEVLGSFNATGPLGEHAGDINGDGVVNFADLNLVLDNYGQQGC